MPVYKRTARPTAATDDPRDPHVSDNDLTVLFRRVTRQVRGPGPPPKPPVAAIAPAARERVSDRERERTREVGGHRTPLAMALPAQERIETVALEPKPRERAVQIGVLLAIGCALGILVEMVARPSAGSWRAESVLATSGATDGAADEPDEQPPGVRPEPRADEAHHAHGIHHHTHHASGAASITSTASTARAPDAGSEADDVAAAVKMLTKAKAEETLP